MKKAQSKISVKAAAVAIAVVVLIGISVAISFLRSEVKVTDFESCKAAGNPIMESYPEQCMYGGVTYTNKSQSYPTPPENPVDTNNYISLTEGEALAKAEKENIPARVVERNGESLPVTMDFVFGRLNLYIKEDKVYKVEVEGQATDAPQEIE